MEWAIDKIEWRERKKIDEKNAKSVINEQICRPVEFPSNS